jgi:hypothetical protein
VWCVCAPCWKPWPPDLAVWFIMRVQLDCFPPCVRRILAYSDSCCYRRHSSVSSTRGICCRPGLCRSSRGAVLTDWGLLSTGVDPTNDSQLWLEGQLRPLF